MLLLLLACSGESEAPRPRHPSPPGGRPPPVGSGELVIPIDDPAWRGLSGLLDNPRAYGEASWDDVRMRVAGHLALAGRDRARLAAGRGDWAGCAVAYRDNAVALGQLRLSGKIGPPIRAALVGAAERDGGLCAALAAKEPPVAGTGLIAPLRARWVGLVLRAEGGEQVGAEAGILAADARAVVAPEGLDLDAFGDFEARHALRVRLVEAWADSVSPFSATEPFSYWTAAEFPRQAAGIAVAAAAVATGSAPVVLAADAVPPARRLPYSASELGSLVTGDSTVDTLGFAGPRAIGTLARLGAEDKEHLPWLAETAAELDAAPPTEVPAIVERRAAKLGEFPGGIRYYAIKQLRNTATRQLATGGHYREALTVVRGHGALHAQDWACPDRAGILALIEARILVVTDDPGALSALDRADAHISDFLAHVAQAETNPRATPGPQTGPPGQPPGPPSAPRIPPSKND